MNDQHVNMLFVGEVEKHPVLYNYNLPGYSNKIETERAWNEVGRHMYMTAPECKERWKNLRAVFVRNMKPKKGKGFRRTYYLSDAMQFALPFIKVLNKLSSENQNSPAPSSAKHEEQEHEEEEGEGEQMDNDDDEENDDESISDSLPSHQQPTTSSSPQQHHHQLSPSPHSTSLFTRSTSKDDTFQRIDRLIAKNNRSLKRSNYAIINRDPKTEALKMFLLSMLPDLQKMTDEEVRRFKRKSIEAVDDIFLARNFAVSTGTTIPSSETPVALITDVKSEYPEEKSSPYHI